MSEQYFQSAAMQKDEGISPIDEYDQEALEEQRYFNLSYLEPVAHPEQDFQGQRAEGEEYESYDIDEEYAGLLARGPLPEDDEEPYTTEVCFCERIKNHDYYVHQECGRPGYQFYTFVEIGDVPPDEFCIWCWGNIHEAPNER